MSSVEENQLNQIDIKKLVTHWSKTSDDDWESALPLAAGKKYSQALFFLHLALEKKLKAIVVKVSKSHAPFSHNLVYLAGAARLSLDSLEAEWLAEISAFNISGRYTSEKQKIYLKTKKADFDLWKPRAKSLINKLDSLLKN